MKKIISIYIAFVAIIIFCGEYFLEPTEIWQHIVIILGAIWVASGIFSPPEPTGTQ